MPAKIPQNASMEIVFDTMTFTRGRVKADKHAVVLLPLLDEFSDRFWKVLQQEYAFREESQAAFALVISRDSDLNDVSSLVIKEILTIAKKGYKDVLYQLYCGELRPYAFLLPILGEQLSSVRKWINLLKNPATAPSLQALLGLVEHTVNAADQVIGIRDKVKADSATFRDVGERKLFIDWCNHTRDQLEAKLEELQYKIISSGQTLPEDWLGQFFRRSQARNSTEAKVDIQSLTTEIASREKDLADLKTQLTGLQQQETERQKVEADLEAAMATLAESQRLADEAKQRAEELRARLGSK